MPLYKCECCNFDTNRRDNYEAHLHTKKHYNSSKKLAEVSHELAKVSQKLADNEQELGDDSLTIKDYVCKYCNKKYKHASSLSKHIKYSCDKNNDEDLKELVRLMNMKFEQELELHRKQIESQNKQIEKLKLKCFLF